MPDGFHEFENIFFLKKKHISISQICSFYCLFVTYPTNHKPNMALLLSKEGVKRDWCQKFLCFERIRYDFTGFDTGFSQKE